MEKECRKTEVVGAVTTATTTCAIDCERFSSWRRLVRVTAWVLRMKTKLLEIPAKNRIVGREPLIPQEPEQSETKLPEMPTENNGVGGESLTPQNTVPSSPAIWAPNFQVNNGRSSSERSYWCGNHSSKNHEIVLDCASTRSSEDH